MEFSNKILNLLISTLVSPFLMIPFSFVVFQFFVLISAGFFTFFPFVFVRSIKSFVRKRKEQPHDKDQDQDNINPSHPCRLESFIGLQEKIKIRPIFSRQVLTK